MLNRYLPHGSALVQLTPDFERKNARIFLSAINMFFTITWLSLYLVSGTRLTAAESYVVPEVSPPITIEFPGFVEADRGQIGRAHV